MAKISILIWLIFPMTSMAQKRFSLELLAGANQSFVRNKVLTGEGPAYGLHIGVSARFFLPKHDKVSFAISALHSQKGYQQTDLVQYSPTFFYAAWQVSGYYQAQRVVGVYGGVEFARLSDVNVIDGLSTYQRNDIGLVAGLRIFDQQRLSLNAQMVYGVKPVLHYQEFDKYGNITGTIKDLKNICISIGMSYKIVFR